MSLLNPIALLLGLLASGGRALPSSGLDGQESGQGGAAGDHRRQGGGIHERSLRMGCDVPGPGPGDYVCSLIQARISANRGRACP